MTYLNHNVEAILMSTHNIYFYGEIWKNYRLMIKFSPYTFLCSGDDTYMSMTAWRHSDMMTKICITNTSKKFILNIYTST